MRGTEISNFKFGPREGLLASILQVDLPLDSRVCRLVLGYIIGFSKGLSCLLQWICKYPDGEIRWTHALHLFKLIPIINNLSQGKFNLLYINLLI